MASTYTSNLRIDKQGTGDNNSTWGTVVNTDLDLIDSAIAGVTSVSTTGGTTTLTATNGAADQARSAVVKITGTLVSNATVNAPATATKNYWVYNGTTGAYTVTFGVTGGAGVQVPAGVWAFIHCDGTNSSLASVPHALWGGTAGGTANALTVTTGNALSALITGMVVAFKAGASANSGAATIAVDSVSATTIQKNGSALVAGDIPAGTIVSLVFDGTYWQIIPDRIPSQAGNSGKFLTTNGSALSWGSASGLPFLGATAKSANYTAVAGDAGYVLACTGTWTLALTAAATLGNGWTIGIANTGTGTITIDPNGSETVNGNTAVLVYQRQGAILTCDGSNFYLFGYTTSGASATTINPSDKSASITLSNGNLTASQTALTSQAARATSSVPSSGLYYWEGVWTADDGSGGVAFGIATGSLNLSNGNGIGQTGGVRYYKSGALNNQGSNNASWGASFTIGDVVGIAVDGATGKVWFSKNGVWQGLGNPYAGTNQAATLSGTIYPAFDLVSGGGGTESLSAVFSPVSWTQTPPSGSLQMP